MGFDSAGSEVGERPVHSLRQRAGRKPVSDEAAVEDNTELNGEGPRPSAWTSAPILWSAARCLFEVAVDLHCAVEDTEDMDFLVNGLEVDDSVVPPKEDPGVPPRLRPIALPQPWKMFQHLSPGVDRLYDVDCGCRPVLGNVVVDFEKPPLCFVGPDYLRQDSIRFAISAFEIVRPASESAIPRSTMAENAISRMISSLELSSGWSSISLMNCALTVLMLRFYALRPSSDAAVHVSPATPAALK